MKVFDLTLRLGAISFAPANVQDEVIQNVRTILTTPKGSIPMDRDFGVSFPLDDPTPRAQQLLNVEIIEAIERYEPRAKVTKVKWSANADGRLEPTVLIRIQDA